MKKLLFAALFLPLGLITACSSDGDETPKTSDVIVRSAYDISDADMAWNTNPNAVSYVPTISELEVKVALTPKKNLPQWLVDKIDVLETRGQTSTAVYRGTWQGKTFYHLFNILLSSVYIFYDENGKGFEGGINIQDTRDWQLVYCTSTSIYVRVMDVPQQTDEKLAGQLAGQWTLTEGDSSFDKKIAFSADGTYTTAGDGSQAAAALKYWAKDNQLYLEAPHGKFKLKEGVWGNIYEFNAAEDGQKLQITAKSTLGVDAKTVGTYVKQ